VLEGEDHNEDTRWTFEAVENGDGGDQVQEDEEDGKGEADSPSDRDAVHGGEIRKMKDFKASKSFCLRLQPGNDPPTPTELASFRAKFRQIDKAPSSGGISPVRFGAVLRSSSERSDGPLIRHHLTADPLHSPLARSRPVSPDPLSHRPDSNGAGVGTDGEGGDNASQRRKSGSKPSSKLPPMIEIARKEDYVAPGAEESGESEEMELPGAAARPLYAPPGDVQMCWERGSEISGQ